MDYKDLKQLHYLLNKYIEYKNYDVPTNIYKYASIFDFEESDSIPYLGELTKLVNQYISEIKPIEQEHESTFYVLKEIKDIINKRHRSVSISEIQCFRRCKLQHYYRYVKRLRHKDMDWSFLNVGSWTDKMIEELYKHGYGATIETVEKIIDKIRVLANEKEIENYNNVEKVESIKKDFAVSEALFRSYYNELFLHEQENGLSMTTENAQRWTYSNINVPNGRKSNKFVFYGKIDGLFDHIDRHQYLHEIKTKASFTEKEKAHLQLDEQITGYLWSLINEGLDIAGILYTVLVKPAHKRRMVKTYNVYFSKTDELKWAFRRKSDLEKHKKSLRDGFDIEKDGKEYVLFFNGIELMRDDKKTPINDFIKAKIDGDYEIRESEEVEPIEEYTERIQKAIAENPEKYVHRETIYRTKEQLEAFGKRVYYESKELAKNNEKRAYPQPAEHYLNYCAMCDFRELCIVDGQKATKKALIESKYVYPDQKYKEKENQIKQSIQNEIDF